MDYDETLALNPAKLKCMYIVLRILNALSSL